MPQPGDKPQKDPATALMRYVDEGEALAARCRAEGHLYLGSTLLAAMRRLEETAGHEFARTKDERSDVVAK